MLSLLVPRLLLLCVRPIAAGLYTFQDGYMMDAPMYVPVVDSGAVCVQGIDVLVLVTAQGATIQALQQQLVIHERTCKAAWSMPAVYARRAGIRRHQCAGYGPIPQALKYYYWTL